MLHWPDRPHHYRSRELNRILEILNDRRPAVIVLTGAPGMGKTSLLDAVRTRAARRGWAIAGGGEDSRLAVDPGTRDHQFRRAVLDSFRQPDDSRSIRARREGAVSGPIRAARVDPFVDELARISPVVLLIDDYRPSPTFAEWFEDDFLVAVRACAAPLVVALAPPDTGRPLDHRATDPIELQPLETEVVRSALLELDAKLDPPLNESELEVYLHEVDTPLLLDSLTRVLALAFRHEDAT